MFRPDETELQRGFRNLIRNHKTYRIWVYAIV